MNRRFSRNKAMKFFESLPCIIGMEACSPIIGRAVMDGSPSANDAGAIKTVCQDAVDAEAIVEAMLPQTCGSWKSRAKSNRVFCLIACESSSTQTINASDKFGLVCPSGAWKVVELEEIRRGRQVVETGERAVVHLRMIRREMKQIEDKIKVFLDENEACQRLAEIPGIGIMTATALVATVGDARQFRSGRHQTALHWRKDEAFGDLETRRLLSSKIVDSWCSFAVFGASSGVRQVSSQTETPGGGKA